MRIRNIIKESFYLPFREYKKFFLVVVLAILNEAITSIIYSIHINNLFPIIMITNSLITLMILGIMISITNNAINNKNINYLNFIENLVEGIKEFILTVYYLFLTLLTSSIFIVPTGIYGHLLHIHEYIIRLDLNNTFLTFHELSHEMSLLFELDFTHSLEVSLLVNMIIFVIFMTFCFIGKIILTKTSNLKKALNFKIIFRIIKNIGILRYFKFIIIIGLVSMLIINLIILLEYLYSEVIFSGILEAFILFFFTNAFYVFIENPDK